jgi:hypothetical protein
MTDTNLVEKAAQSDVRFHSLADITLFSRIHSGYTSLNRDNKLLLVSNLRDGIDEYQFPSFGKDSDVFIPH